MAYYTFVQNNSGGFYRGPLYFIVEASDADEANEVAESYGVYFDGCEKEEDCECCGDRWSRVYESDAKRTPEIFGRKDLRGEDVQLIKKKRKRKLA